MKMKKRRRKGWCFGKTKMHIESIPNAVSPHRPQHFSFFPSHHLHLPRHFHFYPSPALLCALKIPLLRTIVSRMWREQQPSHHCYVTKRVEYLAIEYFFKWWYVHVPLPVISLHVLFLLGTRHLSHLHDLWRRSRIQRALSDWDPRPLHEQMRSVILFWSFLSIRRFTR